MILKGAHVRITIGKADNATIRPVRKVSFALSANPLRDLGVAVVTVRGVVLRVANIQGTLYACASAAAKTDVALAALTLHWYNPAVGRTDTVTGIRGDHVTVGFVKG